MKDRKLVLNRLQCSLCKDIITSYSVHDYKTCTCGKAAIDGGLEYRHITGNMDNIIDLSIYSDALFEEIRKYYCRGGRGINGDEPLKWVPLMEMNDNWLAACITYNKEKGMGKGFANKMYKKEQKYRKKNSICIN